MLRALLSLVLVLAGCHRDDAIRVRVQVPGELKATCVAVDVWASDGREPLTRQVVRQSGRGELVIAVFQGGLPREVQLQARALWGSACDETLRPNGRSEVLSTRFMSGEIQDVTLALPEPTAETDGDGDGFLSQKQEGSDCDDGAAARNPGAAEVCDATADFNCDNALGCADATCTGECAWAPARLVFKGLDNALAGECAGPVTVERQDDAGHVSFVGYDTRFSLANTFPPELGVFGDAACTSPPPAYVIPKGQPSYPFYVKATRPLEGRFTASSEGLKPGALEHSFVSGPTQSLVFTTPARTPVAGECISLMLVRNNAYGLPVTGQEETFAVVLPEMSQAALYQDLGCNTALSSVTFSAMESARTVYFRGLRAGPVEVKLTRGSAQGTQTQTVKAGAATKLTFTPPEGLRLYAGECSGAIAVRPVDTYGNPVPFTATGSLSLGASPGGGFGFYTDDKCQTAAVSGVPYSANATEVTFRFKGSNAGMVEVLAGAAGFTVKQTHTLVAPPLVRRATCGLEGGELSAACPIYPPLLSRDRAFFTFQATSDANTPASAFIQCALTDVSTLTCKRRVGTGKVTINWQAVELASGLRVQHVVQKCSTSPTRVTIDSVNMAKSFVLFSSSQAGETADANDFATAVLKSPTSVEVVPGTGDCGSELEYSLQVVEWGEISVTRGVTGSMGTSDTLDVNSLPALADYTHAIVLSTHQTSAGGAPICDRLVRGEATSPTSLRFYRGAGTPSCNAGAVTAIAWERIAVSSKGTVQVLMPTLEGATADVELGSAVDASRTLFFTSSQAQGGQGSGETSYSADDIPGAASVRIDSVAPKQLRLTRGANLGQGKWTLYVVQFEP